MNNQKYIFGTHLFLPKFSKASSSKISCYTVYEKVKRHILMLSIYILTFVKFSQICSLITLSAHFNHFISLMFPNRQIHDLFGGLINFVMIAKLNVLHLYSSMDFFPYIDKNPQFKGRDKWHFYEFITILIEW